MWFTLLAAALGAGSGELMRRYINRIGYRRDPEGGGLPAVPAIVGGGTPRTSAVGTGTKTAPRFRWWMPVILGLTWGFTAWQGYGTHGWALLALWWPFAAIGLYLAAVDLDVQRLPDRAQGLLALAAVVAGVVTTWGEPRRLLVALATGVGCLVGFWILHLVSRGQVGFGDVKLAATCGFLLGLSGLTTLFAGLVLSCLLALLWSALRRVRQFAFGPWLLLGTWLAGLLVR